MKNEMDAMNMDELQRRCWLLANRATLIIVGLVWLGFIGWELWHHRWPIVEIVLVPVFALVRVGFYKLYAKRKMRMSA